MNDNLTLPASQPFSYQKNSSKTGYLKGLLAVFLPFLSVAIIGGYLGTDTSLAAGVVINLAYLLAIVIATVVLRARGSGWRELGLARPESWPKTIAMSLGTLLVMVAVLIGLQVLWANIPGLALPPSDQSDYNPMAGNLPLFLVMVAAAWTVVAFGEEMVFRAFLIDSLAGSFGNLKGRWVLALAGSSLFFGLIHYDWGIAGIIEMTLGGLILGGVYLRSGRNLWIPLIAHALINTLKFSLIFAGVV